MAVCEYCEGEMLDEISCRTDSLMVDGVIVQPILWGEERESQGRRVNYPCRDCGTPPGGAHHPGCCVERCPNCRGQAIGCRCFEVDDDLDDDDHTTPPLTRVVRHTRYRPLCRAHRFRRLHLR